MRIVWLSLVMLICSSAMAAKLQSIEVKQQSGKTSLFFSLDKAVAHKVFTLTNPERVVVDFDNTNLAVNLKTLNLSKQYIKLVRSGNPNPHTLRLVFEVTQTVSTRTDSWHPSAKIAHGFSLEILPSALQPIPTKAVTLDKKPVAIRHLPAKPLRDVIVVLDAGHGGKDPGAIGPRRTQEKKVVLAIALKLKQIIDRQPGMRAVLTRKGDYYIELRERLKIARKYNGDVFISIHADAFKNRQSSGASVFALSQSGATSEAARWLAEKENYSELGGVNLSSLDDQSGLVRTVLIDLSQTATIGASLHMGESVLRNLNRVTNLHNYRVEQARFMVLKSPDIPSILIETGFISNPREEKNLASPFYQARLTQAIFEGLKRYFWEYPPHGTRIEALTSNKIHIVRKGESLPEIAAKYHVSIANLQAINHLNDSPLKMGRKLLVPLAWG